MTVTLALEALFALFGSGGDVEDAVAVFVSVHFAFAVATIVTVAEAPFASVPSEQETTCFERLHVPAEVVIDLYCRVVGSVSRSETPFAA